MPATIAMIVATAPCSADAIDSHTSCSVAVHAFNSAKRAGQVLAGAPSPEVLEVGDYILSLSGVKRTSGKATGLTELPAGGVTIGGGTLFTSHIAQLAALTVKP